MSNTPLPSPPRFAFGLYMRQPNPEGGHEFMLLTRHYTFKSAWCACADALHAVDAQIVRCASDASALAEFWAIENGVHNVYRIQAEA